MKQYYCKVADHGQNLLNLVCTNPNCENKGLTCSFCILQHHKSHINSCVPLKDLIITLNKANNLKMKSDLNETANDIIQIHYQIALNFKNYIKDLKQSINEIENTIIKTLKTLQDNAVLFSEDYIDESLNLINNINISPDQLNTELLKVLQLVNINSSSQLEVLSPSIRKQQSEKITTMSTFLQRDVEYYMGEIFQDLKNLELNLQKSLQTSSRTYSSENRFGNIYKGWNFEAKKIEAVGIKNKMEKDIWLTGFALHEIDIFPSQKRNQFQLNFKIIEGNHIKGKVLSEETIKLEIEQNIDQQDKTFTIKLNKPLNMKQKKWYTFALETNLNCIGYYGVNGTNETNEFEFQDTIFDDNAQRGSNSAGYGLMPYFYFER